MSLRWQILLGSVLLAALPMILVIRIVGSQVQDRFTLQDTAQVENQMRTVMQDLQGQGRSLAALLDALALTIQGDNRFRLALLQEDAAGRTYVADFAASQMGLMGLDFLQIQDPEGRVLSAGPLRGAAGSQDPRLPELLANAPGGTALVFARGPDGAFPALARTSRVTIGNGPLSLSGGVRLDQARLQAWARGSGLGLAVVWPEGGVATTDKLQDLCARSRSYEEIALRLQRSGAILRGQPLPLIRDGELQEAWLVVSHDRQALRTMLLDIRRRLAVVLGLALLASVILAFLLAGRISRPLRQLAGLTQGLDLDNLQVDFSSRRRDEVGSLTRLLGQMTVRLREGVARLRAAEHRATLGEVARQVNHDIRNGLTPLRNVMRHLAQVAEEQPDRLASVFQERRGTLESGLAYLEDLATHYARLTPARGTAPCRLHQVVAQALGAADRAAQSGPVRLLNLVPPDLPALQADPVSLRRIFDNLVRNAMESLPPAGGTISVGGAVAQDPELQETRLVATVTDSGVGIPPEHLDRIFADFFTTKAQGTGLGLSNVRRLVADGGGKISVTSRAGHGTTFTLSFPLADGRDGEP